MKSWIAWSSATIVPQPDVDCKKPSIVHCSVSTAVFGYAYRTSASFTSGRAVMHVARLMVPITSRPPTFLH